MFDWIFCHRLCSMYVWRRAACYLSTWNVKRLSFCSFEQWLERKNRPMVEPQNDLRRICAFFLSLFFLVFTNNTLSMYWEFFPVNIDRTVYNRHTHLSVDLYLDMIVHCQTTRHVQRLSEWLRRHASMF